MAKVAVRSDLGKERRRNEDNYCSLDGGGIQLYAVADGMGGHAAGDVASYLAIDTLLQFVRRYQATHNKEEHSSRGILFLLEDLINKANWAIYNTALQETDKAGMGTTLTVGMVVKDRFFWGHVGDSRLYLVGKDSMERLTRDHSLAEELMQEGKITPAQAKVHPQKNVLTQALGTAPEVEVELGERILDGEHDLFFCTDGLTALVEEEEIMEILQEKRETPEAAASLLVEKANSRGGSDNITLIYVVSAGRGEAS